MLKQTLIVTSAVLSTALILSGVSVAQQQVVCNPICALTNTPGNATSDANRGKGLINANDKAGVHGVEGRDNARIMQDQHRPGGSGVPDPNPPPPPVVPPPPTSDPPPAPGPTPPPTGGGLPGCTLC